MERSNEINELATALCNAQGEMPAVEKDGDNPYFSSKFATLAQVVKTATPILTKHGLTISQFVTTLGSGEPGLRTWLMHSSGQFICDVMPLTMVKKDPQSQGSAISYSKRYSYMSAIGMVADVDDDGNATRDESNGKKVAQVLSPGGMVKSENGEKATVCKQCGSTHVTVALTKADNPRNPNRPYYKCLDCDPAKSFSHWVPEQIVDKKKAEGDEETDLNERPF